MNERQREAEQQREQREVEGVDDRRAEQSGSVSTCTKLSSPTHVGASMQVRLLQAHDHRLHDRRPREDREDDEHRREEERASRARRRGPRCAGSGAVGWASGCRGRRGARRPALRGRQVMVSAVRVIGASFVVASPVEERGARIETLGRTVAIPRLRSSLGRGSSCYSSSRRLGVGVGLREQSVDVGVLVGQDRLHHRVEQGVDLLGLALRLAHGLLVPDALDERRHLVARHVDVRLDPGERLLVGLAVEHRQHRGADGLVALGERLGVQHCGVLVRGASACSTSRST